MNIVIPPIILNRGRHGLDVVDGQVFFLVLALFTVMLTAAGYYADTWVAMKYSYDSYTIDGFMPAAKTLLKSDSYNNTALFYKSLNIGLDDRWYRGLATAIYCLFFWLAIFIGRPEYFTRSAALITVSGMYIGMIYLSQLSKEFWVLVLALFFFVFSVNRWLNILWIGLALGYAYYFRGYWYLVIYMYIWLSMMGRYARKPLHMVALILAGLLVITVAHEIFNGGSILQHREGVNANREGSADAKTLITVPLSATGIIPDWINSCLIWVQMLLPYKLLITGAPQHIASAIIMFTLFRMLFIGNTEFMRRPTRDMRIYRCFCLFMAYTSVQSVFEPDYGSMLKHMMPLIPLALGYACGLYQFNPERTPERG